MGLALPNFSDIGKSAKSAGGALDGVSKSFKGMGASSSSAAKSSGLARAGISSLAVEAGVGGGVIAKMSGALAKMGPEGIAAAAALVAVAAAVTLTVGAMLAMASAAIDVVQSRAKLLSVFSALGGGAAQGQATVAMVDQLAAKLPFATDQIAAMAQSLASAGLSGDKLRSAVTAVAAATAIMGESGGAAADKMIKALSEGGEASSKMMKQIQEGSPKSARLLADMGLRIKDVAKAAGMSVAQFKAAHLSADAMSQAVEKALANKGAGPLAEMALTFPAMIAKFKDGFFGLFEKLGPAVKPFMKAIQSLFAQFSKGSPIFKALQPIVTAVFGTLFEYATMAATAVSKFIKENVNAKSIGAAWASVKSMFATIAEVIKPVVEHFKAAAKSGALMGGVKAILVAVRAAIVVVVAVGAAIVDMMIGWVEQAGQAVAAIQGIIAIVSGIGDAVSDAVSGGIDALSGLASGAMDAASSFIDGLVNGISAGAGAIIAAVSGLASGALGAFKSILGIASPSKVMAKMGGHFSAGAAQGIDAGAGKVGDAAADLGDVAKGGASKGMSGGAGGKGGGVNVGTLNLILSPGTSREIAEEAFAMLMERLAASQGV